MKFKLLIGLGNADPRYRDTYHNAGYLAVEWLVRNGIPGEEKGHTRFETTDGYMNESGRSVARILTRCRVPLTKTLVIHDDSDLPLGTFKFSFGRGTAGHKGVTDIVQALGTNRFWRLRIGIRPETAASAPEKKPPTRLKAAAFVLKRMPREHRIRLIHTLQKALKSLLE